MEPAPSRGLRVAYLVSQYPAITHTFIRWEIRQLRAMGCDVAVASVRAPDRPAHGMTPEEREEAAGTYFIKTAGGWRIGAAHTGMLALHPVRYVRGLFFAASLGGWDLRRILFHVLYFAEAVMLGRWMAQQGLSHVHSHFSSTVALIARRMFDITMSITIHGPDEFNDVAGFALARKVKDSLFLRATSYWARSQILRTCPPTEWNKVRMIPMGVDPDLYTPKPWRENPEPFEVVLVARLAPVKGHPILVEAMDLLRRQGVPVRLRIVGDGAERSNLEREVAARGLSQQVSFEGWLTQDRVRDLYRTADLFALPSFAEGMPVVLMEAMAMEIPCVATSVNGIPELIEDGTSGILVPPSSAEALAEGIARLIQDPALRRRLGAAGRRQVVEKFSLGRTAALLRKAFDAGLPESRTAAR